MSVLDYACTGGNVCNNIIGEINMYSETTKKYKAIKCDIGNTAEHISDVRKYLILAHVLVNVTQPQQDMDKVNCWH